MAMSVKELCRLCARKDDSYKDLMEESNQNVLKMIEEYIQIVVAQNDDLPTKICLTCEEKIVSFRLFIFECYKAQENLRRMCFENIKQYQIKNEIEITGFPEVKAEVKVEMTADDLVNAINDTIQFEDANNVNDIDDVNDFDDGSDDDYICNNEVKEDSDEELSDVTLDKLKQTKMKKAKRKVMSVVEENDLKNLLKKPNFNMKDFVKLECETCEESFKTWSALRVHHAKVHKSKPILYCICGFVIRSKSVLYKHVSDHRVESRKLKAETNTTIGSEKKEHNKYSGLGVTDFVKFSCTVCLKQFKSWYSLKSHSEKQHKIMPVVQCICGITLKSKSVLYKHVQDHKNPDVICCDKCPRITKTMTAMIKHKMRHVPKSERKFACGSCDKIFTAKEMLKSHERSHIPIEERKIYRCDICDLKFTTRSSAASHKRVVHDKIKAYVCDLCGYACGTGGELRQHRAIHSDDKPHVCRTCAKPFKTYSNLKTHMDTHEETSYACYVCNRVLNSRRTLRKHLLVHEDKCRHVCSYCNKAFKRRQTLKVHMYTHTGDKPLSCKWCEERFAYASTLRSHRLRCHPDKMPLRYPAYPDHQPLHEGYMKADPIPISIPKNDVEAI